MSVNRPLALSHSPTDARKLKWTRVRAHIINSAVIVAVVCAAAVVVVVVFTWRAQICIHATSKLHFVYFV